MENNTLHNNTSWCHFGIKFDKEFVLSLNNARVATSVTNIINYYMPKYDVGD